MKCRVQIGDESFPTYLFFLLKSYSFLALLAPLSPGKLPGSFFRLPGFCKVLHGYHGQEVLIKRTSIQ